MAAGPGKLKQRVPIVPDMIFQIINIVGGVIELLGVGILIIGCLVSIWILIGLKRDLSKGNRLREFNRSLGQTVSIGLEVIVAATVVRTVTVEANLRSVSLLAGIIAVRTIISWTMALDLNGCWPWQRPPGGAPEEE